ncbi:MAG: hypothetical protein HY814_15560 [Candidatus Riflebacteria bacterium]|nr:hypothetical protein [Candidatus Riflebacteria bacterium]
MSHRILIVAVACTLLGLWSAHVYSGPKTLVVGQGQPAQPNLDGGIPAEFGDLVAVDAGFLFFLDGDGTLRRVGLDARGTLVGPVVSIPRK